MSTKNFSPIGPAVWPVIGNIYINVLFYYIDLFVFEKFVQNIDNPGLFLTHPVYLFVAAGQRAGLNCRKFLEGTLDYPIFFISHGKAGKSQSVFNVYKCRPGQWAVRTLCSFKYLCIFSFQENCKL